MLTITTPVRVAASFVAGLLAVTVAPLLVPSAANAATTTTAFTIQTGGTTLAPATTTRVFDPAVVMWTQQTATTGALEFASADTANWVTLRNGSSGPFALGTTTIYSSINSISPSISGLNAAGTGSCISLSSGQLTVTDVAYDGATLTRLSANITGTCSSRPLLVQLRYNATDSYTALKGVTTFEQLPATKNVAQIVTTTFTNVSPTAVAVTDADALVSKTNATTGAVTDACRGTTVAPGASCTVGVSVTPLALGQPGVFVATTIASADLATGTARGGANAFVYDAPTPPAAPGTVKAYAQNDGIAVTWTGLPAPISSYRVYRAVGSGAEEVVLDSDTNTARKFEDTTAHPAGATITYRVRAVDRGEIGALSAPAAAVARAHTTPTLGDRTAMVVDSFRTDDPTARTTHLFVKDSGVFVGGELGLYSFEAEPGDGNDMPLAIESGTTVLAAGTYDLADVSDADSMRVRYNNCYLEDGTLDVTSAYQNVAGQTLEATLDVSGTCATTDRRIEAQVRYKSTGSYDSFGVSASATSLGEVAVGAAPGTSVVTIRNEGLEPGNAGPIALAPATPTTWAVTGSTCTGGVLAPGATCTATVGFTPVATDPTDTAAVRVTTGTAVTSIDLSADIVNLPTAPVNLAARTTKGVVQLTWGSDGLGSAVVRSHVYRGTTPGALTQIADLPATDGYTDFGRTPGVTYYYAVTAVNPAGESARTTTSAKTPSEALVFVRGERLQSAAVVGGVPQLTESVDLRPGFSTYDAAVSPDGQWVAYTGGDEDIDLFVMRVDGTQSRSVENLPGPVIEPDWSPDGKRLAYTAFDDFVDESPDVYTGSSSVSGSTIVRNGASTPSWYPDGKHLLVTRDGSTPVLDKILLGIGTTTTVASGYADGDVSPDGTKIAAVRIDPPANGIPVTRLAVLPAGGGTAIATSPQPSSGGLVGEPAWTLDGRSVWFTSAVLNDSIGYGAIRVARLDLVTKATSVLTSSFEDDYYSPSPAFTDNVAPTSTLGAVPALTWATSIGLAWSATDLGVGVKSYDVRARTTDVSGRTTLRTVANASGARSAKLSTAGGSQSCVSTRARDAVGNVGAWTTEKCVIAPLDQAALKKSKGWSKSSSSKYLAGKALTAKKKGRSLTKSSVSAKRVGVVVRTCSTCGSIDVYLGGKKLGRVSTKGAAGYRKTLWLPARSTPRSGTLKLVTTSKKRVYVDGVALGH